MKSLFSHQLLAVEKLRTGSILCGGVGSGKTLTAIYYYFTKECEGSLDPIAGLHKMEKPKDLYVITTAKKRDTLDWEHECANFMLSPDRDASINGVKVTVDSWNNINKYIDIENAFFIFDEQRVVGSGAWVKSFYKITKKNNWILLSATPGDTWMDYVPVFIANGFYKNRTAFIREHVVYSNFTKFPKIDHYIEEGKLYKFREKITVIMDYQRPTDRKFENIIVHYDKEVFDVVMKKRWNPYENKPIKDVSAYCYVMRQVVNSDPARLDAIYNLLVKHRKLIIFYNFNYELDILRKLKLFDVDVAELNGHKHEDIPNSEYWAYIVQYTSGSEGWNCIETNAIAFYSLNYSYRMMTQAAGRVDRLNTKFATLYYYYIRSLAPIDLAIGKALRNKENFNESKFGSSHFS